MRSTAEPVGNEYGPEFGKACWLVPDIAWGQCRAIPILLDQFDRIVGSDPEIEINSFERIAISNDALPKHQQQLFNGCKRLNEGAGIPPTLEVLSLTNLVSAVLVHCPLRSQSGLPVALGFISFDCAINAKVEAFLDRELAPHTHTVA